MSVSRRSLVAVMVLTVLGGLAVVGRWYEARRARPEPLTDSLRVHVTSGGDHGPGTLREALFIVATAPGAAHIALDVPKVTLETSLPPIVNARGVHLAGQPGGTELDAHALAAGPVLDVAAANASIEGVTVHGCPGSAILLRSTRFRLQSATVQGCDVGVDVAENAADILLERNRFSDNRVGVRFAASIADTAVVGNSFAGSKDAGLWAVRSESDTGSSAISVHDNQFREDHTGIVTGNVALLIEHNEIVNAQEAAIHLVGPGSIIRGNRITGGAGMGIVAENTRGVVMDGNEIDGLAAYGILLRGSANALIRGNRLYRCGYGMAFVLGDATSPSTAVDNTIIEPRFNGVDVIGDAPILRRNQVIQPHALALHAEDYQRPDGGTVRAQPFLEGNSFHEATTIASRQSAAHATPWRQSR